MKTRNTYLFAVPTSEDNKKIDEALKKGELGYSKLSSNIYLGFFEEVNAQSAYQQLKNEFGVEREIHWVHLPPVEITS